MSKVNALPSPFGSGVSAGLARPASAAQVQPLIITTVGLPVHQQFDAWRHQAVPHIDVARPRQGVAKGFAATGRALAFGQFLLYAAELPGYAHSRSAAHIRRDGLDHWMIAICRCGVQRQRSGENDITFRPGVPYVLSMAVAFEAERDGAVFEWLALHVPRDAVLELEPALSAALFRPLDNASGMILADFLCNLRDRLDDLRAADLPYIVTATHALLAAAIQPCSPIAVTGGPQIERLELARVKRLIGENLGSALLVPSRLCTLAGISRSHLYRLFEPLGGVAGYIQRERLRLAHRLLSTPSEQRTIAQIAESVGFFDPSSFSRAFRQEFGCAPRDLRMGALAGREIAASPADRSVHEPRGILALLQRL